MLLRRPVAGRIACDSGGTGQALRIAPKTESEVPALNLDDPAGIMEKPKARKAMKKK
jgi:hypothetical protein